MKTSLMLIFTLILFTPAIVGAQTKSKVEFLNSGAILSESLGLPFSEAVKVADTIHLSGQIGIIPHTLKLIDGGIEAQTKQTMNNIKSTLEAHGLSMASIAKCTIMLADMSEWPKFNAIYKTFFSQPYPARSAFGVNGLAFGARVEVDCLAVDS